MSGSHTVGKLILRQKAADERIEAGGETGDRMTWPAAGLLILLLSAGLWMGIALVVREFLL